MARGQIHALEGILAAVLLVLSLVFALQVSAVTPMTESTSSQHIENQQRAVGQGLLEAAAEDGSLKTALLYWDNDAETYHGSNEDHRYTSGLPDDLRLGSELRRTITERGIAFNLHVNYVDDGEISSRTLVTQGEPSDHAVTVTETVTLFEDDTLFDSSGDPTDVTLQDAEEFYVPNEADGALYNVVEIELRLWRM
ncbi:hypothetical protein EA462_07410 [Natrarchaeobius halalkaliphilus]|uniref:Uncharacterized protein n=1 Tax=Natrarchaeobius halalkaliphilus TaxID=1679091 RepID=A0A3N6LP35_9EURY|nr:hypothetical protein [Natrarchaeobius halalkaliphilus]RQG89837.1 hypothetical protein EA462_07410 [Natrarchaeobius halalkaliphilus]